MTWANNFYQRFEMNKAKFILMSLIIGLLFSACKKGANSNTPHLELTSLTVNITDDQGAKAPGVYVYLYSSLPDDWTSRTNPVIMQGKTDTNGNIKFYGKLEAIEYYIWAEKGCLSNIRGINSTPGKLLANTNNKISIQLAPTGKLSLYNFSNNPYDVFVNNDTVYLGAYGTREWAYLPTGTMTIRVLQLFGYNSSPFDKTFYPNINCGEVTFIQFP